MTRFIISLIYLLLSILGLTKAGIESNHLMEGICALGAFISFFAVGLFFLLWRIEEVKL